MNRPRRTGGAQVAAWPARMERGTLTGKDQVGNGPDASVMEAAAELPVDLWANNLG
jgi:hypothetical protein